MLQAQPAAMFIDLRTGVTSTIGSAAAIDVTDLGPSSLSGSTNCPGQWMEARVEIDLKPPAGSPAGTPARVAHIAVAYEGKPFQWTINVGDSPTNNGFGGNSGDPEHAAEIQVLEQVVSVYSDPQIPGKVDLILRQEVALTDGSLQFTVTDQKVTIGQPSVTLQTSVPTNLLFWLPDPKLSPQDPALYKIYAAFNRVVDNAAVGSGGRIGCGARSATIWVTP